MNTQNYIPGLALLLSGLLLVSCLLPGMIPLNPESSATAEPTASSAPAGSMPTMETDSAVLLETLKTGDFVYLQSLAAETYTDAEYAKPGTLTFTVTVTEDKPTYFNYGWCTTTEEILQQNFEHIRIALYFDSELLGTDVVHPITFTRPDGFVCLDFGVLMSDWAPGEYRLKAVATFNEPINDGAEDFDAGDYIYEYNVTVNR